MFDPLITAAGFFVGTVVGLTGMGGGALMTPMLVLLFGVEPLTAVSSDIVASLIMKPVGGGVHWRRGTVDRGLVKWLVLGSVPSAFLGVLALRWAGTGQALQGRVKLALGVALLVVAVGLVVRPLLARRHTAEGDGPGGAVVLKKLPTTLIGIVGGLVVGITSVGSGSLMMILLLLLYPRLRLATLVGTDLVQAIPLVGSAALGHLLFGEFHFGLTASILVGALPGVYLGARLSSRARDGVIRPALVIVLTASALKLLDIGALGLGLVALGLGGTSIASALLTSRRAPRVPALAEAPAPAEGGGAALADRS